MVFEFRVLQVFVINRTGSQEAVHEFGPGAVRYEQFPGFLVDRGKQGAKSRGEPSGRGVGPVDGRDSGSTGVEDIDDADERFRWAGVRKGVVRNRADENVSGRGVV